MRVREGRLGYYPRRCLDDVAGMRVTGLMVGVCAGGWGLGVKMQPRLSIAFLDSQPTFVVVVSSR